MALYVSLSRPRRHGGEGQRLLLWPQAQTVEASLSLAGAPDRVPVLIGNPGVGKSSLAQAGVLAALKRQTCPADEAAPKDWPHEFAGWPALVLSHMRAGCRAGCARWSKLARHLAARSLTTNRPTRQRRMG